MRAESSDLFASCKHTRLRVCCLAPVSAHSCWPICRFRLKILCMKNVACFVLSAGLLLAAALTPPAFGQDTQRQYLSGHGKDDAVPWKFFCTAGNQSGYWTNLPVPFNWELKGFGELNYQYDPTNVPIGAGPLRTHVHRARRMGRPAACFSSSKASMTDTRATSMANPPARRIREVFIVSNTRSRGSVKFGATEPPRGHRGQTIGQRVASIAPSGTGDYWLFGGIYPPGVFEAVPAQFIERVAIDAARGRHVQHGRICQWRRATAETSSRRKSRP